MKNSYKMVEVRGASSNRNQAVQVPPSLMARPIGDLSKANYREIYKMVEDTGTELHHVFQNLAEWESILNGHFKNDKINPLIDEPDTPIP